MATEDADSYIGPLVFPDEALKQLGRDYLAGFKALVAPTLPAAPAEGEAEQMQLSTALLSLLHEASNGMRAFDLVAAYGGAIGALLATEDDGTVREAMGVLLQGVQISIAMRRARPEPTVN